MNALTSATFNCAQINDSPKMEGTASLKKTLFGENQSNTDAVDNVTAQAAKTTLDSTQKQPEVSLEAVKDTDVVSETKLSSQVCRNRITSPFALVLIQSKRISNEHSRASSHVSLSPSTGLQDNSAADTTNDSKKGTKHAKNAKPQKAAPAVSETKKKKVDVSP